MFAFFMEHQVICTAVLTLLLSAAVRALPKPNGSLFYRWFYDFTHAVLSNYDKLQKEQK